MLLFFVVTILLLVTVPLPLVVEVGSDALADGTWLAALFNATNGSSWSSGCGTNWNITNPASVCSTVWSKVSCNATGSSGVVMSVNLRSCNLQGGQLPEIVGTSLAYCSTLYLSSNSLTGTLPPSFASLSLLQHLYLYSNSLTGTISPSFSSMFSLQDLYLNSNSLTGTIPPSFSSLSSLQALALDSNSLTGTIPPSFSNLSSLLAVNLSHNSLTGSLPPSFSSLASLHQLYLYYNSLTGTLPSSWYSLRPYSGCTYCFNVSYNYLTGDIPSSWLWRNATITGWYLTGNCLNVSNMTAVTATGRWFDTSGAPRSNASLCAAVAAAQARRTKSLSNNAENDHSASFSSSATWSPSLKAESTAPQAVMRSVSTSLSIPPRSLSRSVTPSIVRMRVRLTVTSVGPGTVGRTNPVPSAVQAVALLASVAASSASAAFVVQRGALVLRLMSSCGMSLDDVPDVMTSPTQLQIGYGVQRYQRGTVIGNVSILVAITTLCVFVCFAAAWWSLRAGNGGGGIGWRLFWRMAASLHLPGMLVIFWSVLLQPLVAAIGCLLLLQPAAAVIDIVVGLAGLLVVVLVLAQELRLIVFRFRATWKCRKSSSCVKKKESAGFSFLKCLDLRSDGFEWQDEDKKEDGLFVKHFGMIFTSYRPGPRRCFHLVDSLFAIVSAVMQAVASVFSDTTTSRCSGEVLLYTMCALQVIYFVMVVMWRPQAETSEYIKAAMMSCLGAISALLAVSPTCADGLCGTVAADLVQTQVYLALVDMCVSVITALWNGRVQRFVISLIAPSRNRVVPLGEESITASCEASDPVVKPPLSTCSKQDPLRDERVDPVRLVRLAELIEGICTSRQSYY